MTTLSQRAIAGKRRICVPLCKQCKPTQSFIEFHRISSPIKDWFDFTSFTSQLPGGVSWFHFFWHWQSVLSRSQCKILISFFFKSTTSSFSFRCKNWPHSLHISLSRSSAVSLNCIQWKGEVKFLVVFYVYLVCRRPLIWAWISLSRHVYVDRWPFPLRGDAEDPCGSIASLIRRLVTSLMFMHASRLALATTASDPTLTHTTPMSLNISRTIDACSFVDLWKIISANCVEFILQSY